MIGGTMRKITLVFTFLVIVLLLGLDALPAAAQASSAYDVVAAVNDFRTSNGLPALQVDPILMSVAQAHSDYQASIGTVTHTGAGGTRPVDRAIAAGFGGGATVFISENIAGGLNMSISKAIWQYWQDDVHLHTMLNPAAIYIGAGVGKAGDTVYYTVDTGYYAGASAPTQPGGGTSVPASTVVAYDPFVVSTPREDGAIIHIVGFGQTLIGIADKYGVELNDLLQLNNLTMKSVIYPKEEIIIKPSHTPGSTELPTNLAPTITPSRTVTGFNLSPTPRGTFTPRPSLTFTPTTTPMPMSAERVRLVIGVASSALLVFVGVLLVGMFKRK
jgi:LysM repeat protein